MTKAEELRDAAITSLDEHHQFQRYAPSGCVDGPSPTTCRQVLRAIQSLIAYHEQVGRVAALEKVGCKLQNWQRPKASDCIEAKVVVVDYGPGGDVQYEMTPVRRCKNCRLLAEAQAALEAM